MADIFVFGTLKRGFPNHHHNHGVKIPGQFTTLETYPLYLVGERCSPWLLDAPGQGFQVTGEVYRVDSTALSSMDQLERVKEADGYRRREIKVLDERGNRRLVQVYLKPLDQQVQADIRVGPLAEYLVQHADLYRSRHLVAGS